MSRQNITILGIAPYRFLPAVNGGHKAIEQLYNNLGRAVKTTVVSVKSNDEKAAVNYKLIRLFSNSFLHYINVFYFFSIRRLIRQQNITHLFIEHPYMGWLGFLLKKYTGVAFIVRSHNIEAERFKTIGKWWWKAMWQYEKWVLRKADLGFFITEEDKVEAISNYGLTAQKCDVLTYGITRQKAPSFEEKSKAKNEICYHYRIPFSHCILLFNGDLAYEPNKLAVEFIITEINPLLSKQSGFLYAILICGRNLDDSFLNQIKSSDGKIVYAGFVNDIDKYNLAADIFINPVLSGGGIKTKLVEALSFGCSAVSTATGATGVPSLLTNGKLTITSDNDWQTFANAIVHTDITQEIPSDFYEYFNWGNIAAKAIATLQKA